MSKPTYDVATKAWIDELPDGIREEVRKSYRLGQVLSSDWQAYTWKNELQIQTERIAQHIAEIATGKETAHNPLHMIERAVGVAAICMRRLIECHLVTDAFRTSHLSVFEVHRLKGETWREPYIMHTARELHWNYDLRARHPAQGTPKQIADRMLHAKVVAVLIKSAYLPDGLLIASDKQQKQTLFHFTPAELSTVFTAFLTDRVEITGDGYLQKADDNFDKTEVWATRNAGGER